MDVMLINCSEPSNNGASLGPLALTDSFFIRSMPFGML
jgi:hypothetical protein